MATYNPLKIQQQKLAEQQAALEKQIAELMAEEKAQAIGRARALMAEFGIKTAELETTRRGPLRLGRSAGKSVARYRDPASGATWSGKGRRPGWYVQWLADGKPAADLGA
jgi:DNA-binding protein H-NS